MESQERKVVHVGALDLPPFWIIENKRKGGIVPYDLQYIAKELLTDKESFGDRLDLNDSFVSFYKGPSYPRTVGADFSYSC